MNNILQYYSAKSIQIYYFILFVATIFSLSNHLPINWIITGSIAVLSFFYFTNKLYQNWAGLNSKTFVVKVFRTSLIIRILYVIFSYFYYKHLTGQPFEFAAADSLGYHQTALWYIDLLKNGELQNFLNSVNTTYSDLGYPIYLTIMYSIFGPSILLIRIFKAIISAYTCLLIYRLAERNFGNESARLAAVMTMLLPNLIYYCGLHVKETEMVFLLVLFTEKTDILIRSRNFNIKYLFLPVLLGISLFYFRTVLGITAFLSILIAFIFTSKNIINHGYRLLMIGVAFLAIILVLNSKLELEIMRYWGERSHNQEVALTSYSEVKSGNKFSKFGKASVFAPIVLIAPFPTMVNIKNQQNQMFLHGGFYVRNTYAFFIFIALINLWKTRDYKLHIPILAITFSYLWILVMSKFAISERFHLPIVPFLLILAANGISQIRNSQLKYLNWYLMLVIALILGWNWFKLAGRGII